MAKDSGGKKIAKAGIVASHHAVNSHDRDEQQQRLGHAFPHRVHGVAFFKTRIPEISLRSSSEPASIAARSAD
jgi:hypothetical protein